MEHLQQSKAPVRNAPHTAILIDNDRPEVVHFHDLEASMLRCSVALERFVGATEYNIYIYIIITLYIYISADPRS